MEKKNSSDDPTNDETSSNISVSPFDYSVENHFNAMNTIRKLCRTDDDEEEDAIDRIEIEKFNSRITFLREWKQFYYKPRNVRFSCEHQQGKSVVGEVNLPQFSAADVPKIERLWSDATRNSETRLLYKWGIFLQLVLFKFFCSKDFVLYVGGHVWALDWCPIFNLESDCQMRCEYLAVATHPPESSYHKIGTPLTGRGVVQIWCLLHDVKEEELLPVMKIQRRKTKKDVEEEKDTLSLKRPRGRPRKVSLDDSNLENQMIQATATELSNEKEKMLPPPKKGRGRARQKNKKECIIDSDTENESFPALAVDRSQVSPGFLALIDATRSKEEHDLRKGCDTHAEINDSNRENQMVQAPAVQLCSVNTKKPQPTKKGKGRPKKQKAAAESLDTEIESVQALAVDTSQVSSGFLALTDATRSKGEHTMLDRCDTVVELDDDNRENQMVQASVVQLCNAKEKDPRLAKKGRGRPRKWKVIEESLDKQSESVPALTVDKSQVSSGFIALSDATRSAEEHSLLKRSNTDVALDDQNREKQMVQTPLVQLGNAKEKLLPLKKARGRPRKGISIEKSVDTENQSVPDYSVDISEAPSGFLALIDATRSSEHALQKSCDTDVYLDDSIRGSEMVQSPAVQLCSAKMKNTLPLKKVRGVPRKKKDTKVALADVDTEKKYVSAVSVHTSLAAVGIASLTTDTTSTEELDPLKLCDTDIGVDAEIPNQSSIKRSTRKRKIKFRITAEGEFVSPLVPAQDETITAEGEFVSPFLPAQDENRNSFVDVMQESKFYGQDELAADLNIANNGSLEVSTGSFDPPKDVALPRVVLCLAHNGKVAWDVKWRPSVASDIGHKHRMGYLAVLLGNGSLEVWEVPSLKAIEVLYSSCIKEGTDPRFVKLDPVFRCSKLQSGDRHSIPLTVEWSTSSPHDLLLAGCHDGTVALWKFSANGISEDTRPLLCFSADTLPIRALAWAPDESDEESANIVVTAGHGGVRFWDIRDPYRSLCDLNSVRRFIYSVDWLQDPRCLIMAFDDGTLRILSLSKAANDVPVTGKPFAGTQQQGLLSFFCSSLPIWSVQASRLTGQVLYCCVDGSVLRFQLDSKAVDKDHSRYRAPHFLCGSLTEEDASLTINTPLPNNPLLTKKPLSDTRGTPSSLHDLLTDSTQEKKTIGPAPDEEPLALCYDDDPSFQIGSGDMVAAPKGKIGSKTSKKRNPESDSAREANSLPKKEKHDGVRTEVEVLPPKIVAMHRVRWNMNKGSGRWLCYGGAAGIVRCQEISASSAGQFSLSKK